MQRNLRRKYAAMVAWHTIVEGPDAHTRANLERIVLHAKERGAPSNALYYHASLDRFITTDDESFKNRSPHVIAAILGAMEAAK